MNNEQIVYISELSPEDKELLEIAKIIRERGQDPIRILKFYLDAQGAFEKASQLGKEAENFLRKQWDFYKDTHKR